jgi:polysaccharide export outer membrane protein
MNINKLSNWNRDFVNALGFFLAIVLLSSCFTSKPVPYFNGNVDTSKIQDIRIPEHKIQKGDLLSITIYSDNPDATAIFNQAGGTEAPPVSSAGVSRSVTNNVTNSSGASTYLVDLDGNIRMHAIGVVHVEGLTKEQMVTLITEKISKLNVLTNPYIVARLNNFKVTVLGEVKSPGVYTLPGEKATVLDALGLAGDFTDFGIKNKVLLVREEQGKRYFANLDLTDPALFASPNYYLKQNDMLVVSPNPKKPTAQDQKTIQYASLALALVSTVAVLITLFQ